MRLLCVSACLALMSTVPVMAQTVDPAPSGRELSETHVDDGPGAVTMPGKDGTVDVTQDGNTTRMDFDPRGNEVPGHSDDSTIVDHRK